MEDKYEKAVRTIAEDLCSRSGLEDEWEMIDEEIRREIMEDWVEILRGILRA